MNRDTFAQEDIQEGEELVAQQQRNWEELTGMAQSRHEARNLLAFRGELTAAQLNALVWQWGA